MADEWPSYLPGRRDHFHAVGVIAVTYTAFQRSLATLYTHHPQRLWLPSELIELYYSSLSEGLQLKAIRTVFRSYETDPNATAFLDSLISYFDWCADARNKLLHAEFYPAAFGGRPDKLHLTKPLSKKDRNPTYFSVTVDEVRDIADRIEHGKRQCAAFIIYLRCRDIPKDQLPRGYEGYLGEPLPEPLTVPPELVLSKRPV
jgi:hypothetical protein